MKIHAWKTDLRLAEQHKYHIQINEIPGKRAFKRIIKEMCEEWDIYGDGFDKHQKNFVLLATREFESVKKWIEWARNVPYDVVEYNRNGKRKPIKLGTNYRRKAS